jgi:hypothetical protein
LAIALSTISFKSAGHSGRSWFRSGTGSVKCIINIVIGDSAWKGGWPLIISNNSTPMA